MSKGNYVVGTREPSGGDKVRGDKGTRQKVSPSGSKEEWRGGIRGQTYESERDVLRGVRRCNRTYTSQRGCERDEKKLREGDCERGEKS